MVVWREAHVSGTLPLIHILRTRQEMFGKWFLTFLKVIGKESAFERKNSFLPKG